MARRGAFDKRGYRVAVDGDRHDPFCCRDEPMRRQQRGMGRVIFRLSRCTRCGEALRIMREEKGPMTAEKGTLACPHCGQLDAVSKLNVVVQSGMSVGGYVGTTTSAGYMAGEHGGPLVMSGRSAHSGGSRTILSQRLAPPPRPTYDPTVLWKSWAWSGLAILVGLWLTSVHDALFGIPICAVALYYMLKNYRKDRESRSWHRKALDQWANEVAVWNRTYYCSRDDLLFIPGGEDPALAEDLRTFLWLHTQ